MSLNPETFEVVVAAFRNRIRELTVAIECIEREFIRPGILVRQAAVEEAPRQQDPPPPAPQRVSKPAAAPPPAPAPAPAAVERKPVVKDTEAVRKRAPRATPTPERTRHDGDTLRELRQAGGWSQAAVGDLAGYKNRASGASCVGQMEAGRMKVPAGLVELLRKRLADKKLGAHGRVAS